MKRTLTTFSAWILVLVLLLSSFTPVTFAQAAEQNGEQTQVEHNSAYLSGPITKIGDYTYFGYQKNPYSLDDSAELPGAAIYRITDEFDARPELFLNLDASKDSLDASVTDITNKLLLLTSWKNLLWIMTMTTCTYTDGTVKEQAIATCLDPETMAMQTYALPKADEEKYARFMVDEGNVYMTYYVIPANAESMTPEEYVQALDQSTGMYYFNLDTALSGDIGEYVGNMALYPLTVSHGCLFFLMPSSDSASAGKYENELYFYQWGNQSIYTVGAIKAETVMSSPVMYATDRYFYYVNEKSCLVGLEFESGKTFDIISMEQGYMNYTIPPVYFTDEKIVCMTPTYVIQCEPDGYNGYNSTVVNCNQTPIWSYLDAPVVIGDWLYYGCRPEYPEFRRTLLNNKVLTGEPLVQKEEDYFSLTAEELEAEIQQIRDWFYNLPSGVTVLTLANGEGGVNYQRDYYFYNGQLFFAYIFNDQYQHRLYFKGEHLIRYIDPNGYVYDYPSTAALQELSDFAFLEAYFPDQVKQQGTGGSPTGSDSFTISKAELEAQIELIRQYFYYPDETVSGLQIPIETDGIMYNRDYYLQNGHLIFAYFYNGMNQHRLYFKDDHLIRYIDPNGTIYDYPDSNYGVEFANVALYEAYYPPLPDPIDPKAWIGTWVAQNGEKWEITGVDAYGLTAVHHFYYASGGMGTKTYYLYFRDQSKTSVKEDNSVLSTSGWMYQLFFNNGSPDYLIQDSRYDTVYFYRAS